MGVDRRAIGGISNKRGNRYEDYFATYKLVRAAQEHAGNTSAVRMRDQAQCPVDDFVSREAGRVSYYQLKASKTITWGTDNGKLEKEFVEQKAICEAAGEDFCLVLVVNDQARKDSFERNMPVALAPVTDVLLFPEARRIKDLLADPELLGKHLDGVRALRHPRKNTDRYILEYTHSAWSEHEPDDEGYCVLSQVLASIKAKNEPLFAFDWSVRPEWWSQAEQALAQIPAFEWWVDRGYFEFKCGSDQGACDYPCDSPEFERFARRILQTKPTTFNAFEEQL